jgi:predicted dehydrogenase
MGKTYRVGVVGVGGIAKTHMPGWEGSGMAEVTACSDITRKGTPARRGA